MLADLQYKLENLGYWFAENWQVFALMGIASIPTILYWGLVNAGYQPPFIVTSMAVNTWFKGIVGISLGVVLGYFVTKKWGS